MEAREEEDVQALAIDIPGRLAEDERQLWPVI